MVIYKLYVQYFRCFEEQLAEFSPQLTIIIGPNARGKTSLLEALYTGVIGTGFRETKEEELIKWNRDFMRITMEFKIKEQTERFEVVMRKIDATTSKMYLVNKTKQPLSKYRKQLISPILFTPDDLLFFTGLPSLRRKYLDHVLTVADETYKKYVLNYEGALRKRNKLLEIGYKEHDIEDQLQFWDNYLEKQANVIQVKRKLFIDFLQNHNTLSNRTFFVDYIPSYITSAILQETRAKEFKQKRTLCGPQKDNIHVYMQHNNTGKKNIHLYGSRSEQRFAMFWIKLQEIAFVEQQTKKKPILLLDDVFSEFDDENKKQVIQLIHNYQSIITTTDYSLLDVPGVKKNSIEL